MTVQLATRGERPFVTISGYSGPRRPFVNRAIGAAMLDVTVYEEVEADSNATMQAAGVVALSAIAAAIRSSGLIPCPSSKRDGKEYGVWKFARVTFIVPLPPLRPPFHSALALRFGIDFLPG